MWIWTDLYENCSKAHLHITFGIRENPVNSAKKYLYPSLSDYTFSKLTYVNPGWSVSNHIIIMDYIEITLSGINSLYISFVHTNLMNIL